MLQTRYATLHHTYCTERRVNLLPSRCVVRRETNPVGSRPSGGLRAELPTCITPRQAAWSPYSSGCGEALQQACTDILGPPAWSATAARALRERIRPVLAGLQERKSAQLSRGLERPPWPGSSHSLNFFRISFHFYCGLRQPVTPVGLLAGPPARSPDALARGRGDR